MFLFYNLIGSDNREPETSNWILQSIPQMSHKCFTKVGPSREGCNIRNNKRR
jgi:hypothetical protein